MDTGEAAIDFLPRRSHQLIATPITPRLPPRSVVPVCRFAWAPRSISPLSLSCLGSFLFYRFVRFVRFISSSHLALLPFLSLSRRCLPHSWRRIGGGDGRQRRWRRGFSLRAVFLSSLSFALSSGSHHRGGLDGRDRLIVSSSHHLIISSVRLISLVPRCPIISSRSGGVGACHLSSKQRQHGGLLGSSSHPIPVMGRLARASRLMRLVKRLARYTRDINE